MGRVNSLMNIEFDSEPVCGDNDKYIKTKIKSHRDKRNASCQGKKIPKEDASYKYLSLIMLDSESKTMNLKMNLMANLLNLKTLL